MESKTYFQVLVSQGLGKVVARETSRVGSYYRRRSENQRSIDKMNNMRPIWKRLWAVGLCVLCVVFVVTLFGLYKFYRMANQIYDVSQVRHSQQHGMGHTAGRTHLSSTDDTETESPRSASQVRERTVRHKSVPALPPVSIPSNGSKGKTFLLLGVDSRQGEQARADTILLATLPPDGGEVHLLSIPRDTFVHVAGHGYTKINHAMSYGGLPLMKRTVESFMGMPIDHTVTVDFAGFRKLVNELGGLDNVVVEKTMHYDDPTDGTHIHLYKGQILKNGKQALDYARFRHDAEADTGRMRRQQQVIRAMIQKGSEPQNWKNMFRVAEIVGDHVKTDLPPHDWIHLIMTYAYTKPEQVKTMTIQGENRISPKDQLWYFFVKDADRIQASRQLQAIRRGE
jgi:polyisoprenyl-teichoic acid--peptidoglycan teichoic acid transferase